MKCLFAFLAVEAVKKKKQSYAFLLKFSYQITTRLEKQNRQTESRRSKLVLFACNLLNKQW